MKPRIDRAKGYTKKVILLVLGLIFCLVIYVGMKSFIKDSPCCTLDIRIALDTLDGLHSNDFSVLRVKPHVLTADECKKFAQLLFSDSASFYETDSGALMERLTTEEEILKLEQLNNDEVILDLYEASELGAVKRVIRETIEILRNTEHKSRDMARKNCTWEFRPLSYYLSSDPDPKDDDGSRTIMAYVENGAMSYRLWMTSRDESDYRIQNVSVYLSSECSSPYDIETLHMLRRLCGNRRPSEIELEAALEKASDIVKGLGLGEWTIIDSQVEVYSYWRNKEKPLYVVNVTAVPCYHNLNLLHIEQLEAIKGSGALSDYYYSELLISLSPSGELVEASLTSPLDIVSVVEANVDVIDSQQSMDSLTAYMDKWGAAILQSEGFSEKDGYKVHVIIDDVKLGLARVNTKDRSGDFLLVPALQFRGDYAIMRGNKLIYSYRDLFGQDYTFGQIDLTDGAIVNSRF